MQENKKILFWIIIFLLFYLKLNSQQKTYKIKIDTPNSRWVNKEYIYQGREPIVGYGYFIDTKDSARFSAIYFKLNQKEILSLNYGPNNGLYKNTVAIFFRDTNKIIRENCRIEEHIEEDSLGLKNGLYYSFYDNGQLKERGIYQNNVKIGKWIYYYNNGEIKSKGNYSGDFYVIINPITEMKVSILNSHLDTIKLEETSVDFKEFWDSIPKIIDNQGIFWYPYIYSRKIGEWDYFDRDGNLIKKEYYNKNGLYLREFYKNGEAYKKEQY